MMKKLGVDFASMNLIADVIEHKGETAFKDGDLVMINAQAIMDNPSFEKMQPEYQEFIKDSVGKIFTVVKEDKYIGKPIVSLAEDPGKVRWLFWEGDLCSIGEDKDVSAKHLSKLENREEQA